MNQSVQPEWMKELPFQQQSVIYLASRGPDGIDKHNVTKNIHKAYRATVFIAAKHGKRLLEYGKEGDSFMCLWRFSRDDFWHQDINSFLDNIDSLPHHYILHITHGAQILGYKHPDSRFRLRWQQFYLAVVNSFHMKPETEEEMDARLKD